MTIDFDDEDWIDIAKKAPGQSHVDEASVRISLSHGARHPGTFITLRGDLQQWALSNGPAFKVQIGGVNLNLIRLSPSTGEDAFPLKMPPKSKSSILLVVGCIKQWPAEIRASVAAKVERDKAGNPVLILPNDWAKPQGETTPRATPKPAAARPAPVQPKPTPIPITTRAQGLEMDGKIVAKGGGSLAHNFGDPPPGRSALDSKPPLEFPEYLGSIRFSPQERIMCGLLLSREQVSPEAFLAATAAPGVRDDRGKELAGTVVSNIRKKFTPLGIEISSHPGMRGYFLSDRTKAALQRLVDGAQ